MGPPAAPARGRGPLRQSIVTQHKPDAAKAVDSTPRSSGGQSSADFTETSEQTSNISEDAILSPSVEQEETRSQVDEEGADDTVEAAPQPLPTTRNGDARPARQEPARVLAKTASPKPKPTTSVAGSTGATAKENDQLKAKLRVMEKKRMEDREKLKDLEEMRQEKERLQGLIQRLQQKFAPVQEEITDLRRYLAETEATLEQVERKEAEKDSMIEMANIDKETADEMAEYYKSEMETLQSQKEELELEIDVLRQENDMFNEDIPAADKSSQGWMHMEREKIRLKEALIRLKEISQEREGDLNSVIKGLKADVDELEGTRKKYEHSKEQIKKHDETIGELRGQLEAAEAQDEVMDSLTEDNEKLLRQIHELRGHLEEYEEIQQINDELELDNQAAQKELQAELDYRESVNSDLRREFASKLRDIEELQYMAGRYRDAMTAYEKQFEEMRQSNQISATTSAELNEKSRAVMDLQMKLQSTESKNQTKRIEVELQRLKAEEATEHLSILQNFIVESFDRDRTPVEALLRFRRMAFKALTMETVLRDESTTYVSKDVTEILLTFELEEKLDWVNGLCTRFVTFGSHCSVEEFATLGQAFYETEPLERSLNVWIDALKTNELDRKHCTAELSKYKAILIDLSEKLIPSTLATEADALHCQTLTIQSCLHSAGTLLPMIQKIVTTHAETEDDQDAEVEANWFSKKVGDLGFASRSTKVVAGKAANALEEMIQRSLSFNGASSEMFEPAETLAQKLSSLVRTIIHVIQVVASDEGRQDRLTYADFTDIMNEAARGGFRGSDQQPDIFEAVRGALDELHTRLSELLNQATDISRSTEFERRPAPWTVRAKELKANRELTAETEQTLRRLQADLRDKVEVLTSKDQKLEEQHLRIELLESRTRDSKQQAAIVKDLETELEKARNAMIQAQNDYSAMAADYEALQRDRETDKSQLESLKRAQLVEGGGNAALPIVDQGMAMAMEYQLSSLKQEIDSLQAAIRYFKEENHRLQMPLADADLALANHTWLTTPLPSKSSRSLLNSGKKASATVTAAAAISRESRDLFDALLDAAESFQPVDLRQTFSPTPQVSKGGQGEVKSSWRPIRSTPRYQILRQKEEWEEWEEWKNDLLARGQWIEGRGPMATRKAGRTRGAGKSVNLNGLPGKGNIDDGGAAGERNGRVDIVANSPH